MFNLKIIRLLNNDSRKISKQIESSRFIFAAIVKKKSNDAFHEKKRNHSFIRLMNCFFSFFVLNKVDVNWILIVRNSSHNHSLIIKDVHSALRKLAMTFDTMSKIDNQSKTKITFIQVLIFMRLEDEDCILRSRDIYNVKQLFVAKFLNLWHQLNFFWKVWIETLDIINIESLFSRIKLFICFSSQSIRRNCWRTTENFY
jgi:hypothetical protein